MKKQIYLQCGWEDNCKSKECLNCPRKKWKEIRLTLAEEIAIEDFAIGDIETLRLIKPKQLELLQKIMHKLMKKIYEEKS